VGPVDLVLFAVKTYDLEEAGRAAVSLLDPQTVVLPLENGLDAPSLLGQLLGAERVLPGVTYISAAVAAPGLIRQVSGLRRVVFGEAGGPPSPRAERIRDVLAASGIEAILTDDVQAALWRKFTLMAPTAGVCAAARLPLSAVLACLETRALYLRALEEAAAVARAEGVALPVDIAEQTRRTSEAFPPATRPSMLVDLEAGRRLELEALNGAMVRRGEALGVATPTHWVLYALLKPWAMGTPG
jgi:2-dehydropantoate 2-reductase